MNLRTASLLALLCLPSMMGCGAPRAPLYGHSTVVARPVSVRVRAAHLADDRAVISALLQNRTGARIVIERRDVVMRLPSGQIIAPPSRWASRAPILIEPWSERPLKVTFRAGPIANVGDVELLVRGANLARSGPEEFITVVSLNTRRRSGPPPAQTPAEPEAGRRTTTVIIDHESSDAELEDESDDSADEGEDWQIGQP